MKSLHLSVVIKLQSLVPESLIYDITNKYFTNNMYNSKVPRKGSVYPYLSTINLYTSQIFFLKVSTKTFEVYPK